MGYSSYLAEYEQYLLALQHMRRLHLSVTRRDPARAAPFTVSRATAKSIPPAIAMAAAQFQGANLTKALDSLGMQATIQFGSLACLPSGTTAFGSSVGTWETISADTDRSGAATPTQGQSTTPSPPDSRKARQKAAKRRQRKARLLRKKEARSAALATAASEKRAELDLNKASEELRSFKEVVSKRSARRQKRAQALAARASAPASVGTSDPLPAGGPNRAARRRAIYGPSLSAE